MGQNVLIYALYSDDYYDCSNLLSMDCEKEDLMKEYCSQEQYKIEEIVRNSKSDYMLYKLNCFLEVINKYKSIHSYNSCLIKLNKVIIYDLYELCYNIDEFNVIFSLLNDEHIELEAMKQGKISKKSFKESEAKKYEK